MLFLLFNMASFNIWSYWAIMAVSQAINYFRKYQDREFRLVQAQLQALRMQLNPHFLFNTLNAISELVYEAPETAERTITQLSDLLRLSLKSGQAQEITLREELDFLQKYTEIQQTLLQERLRLRWEVDPQTFDACVPNMILQPLVENSIRHGLATRAGGGEIAVSAERLDGGLHLSVVDDGIGLAREGAFGAGDENGAGKAQGVGLRNTRARLERLYGRRHSFELRETPGGGLTVRITIPFREDREERALEDTHADS
jgi:sensor histidine kinase YesM